MKRFIRIMMVAGMLLNVLVVNAQTDEFETDLLKFLKISGSTSTYDLMYDQLTPQLK